MIKSIAIFITRFIKKIALKLSLAEITAACNKQVINKGSRFLPEAKVINMQNNPQKIVLGKNSYVRGELLLFPYGGQIAIGDNCYVGEGTRIWSGENIFIGNNVLISHNVNIMDTNAHELDHLERSASYINIIKNGHPKLQGSVQTAPIFIEDYVWINFNVTILKGVKIGKGAIVGAGSVVTKDVPPFVLLGGNPAKILKYLKENKNQL